MNASDAVQTAQAKPPTGDTATDAANQVGGINISLSIGTSKSSSKTTQTSSTAQSSQVVAGGDINITATGAGQDSDINVVGSQVKAGNNITLKAEDEINLIAAKNNDTLNSKNKNSSASLGVSFGTSGFAVTASASQGKGKANGTDVTWTETALEAGNKVTLESGTDTNLIGAQVRGEQVVADVGTSGDGNLNIQSLQDTSTYDSKQKSAGISVSVPIGAGAYGGSISASQSKINSDYVSVNEQSGIFAGDGGFQVTVNGNTNLTGAVIASTEQAIADNKNSLTTETLTVSNIQNKAEYEAKGSSATVGYGSQGGLPQLSGAGVGSDSDKASSTTVSALSQGTVSITDNEAQQNLTGKDGATTVALLNRDVHVNEQGEAVNSQGESTANTIAPIFDAEKVAKEIQAQVQITQAFSQEAPRALNSFAQSQMKSYLDANKTLDDAKAQLELTTDPAEQEQLQTAIIQAEQTIIETQADYEKWKEGGDYRVASNIIIAAISGGTSGAVGAVTQESLSWAADVMRQAMIKDSEQFPGICVAGTNDCISNKSGDSVGVNGDGKKVAGGRVVLEYWCDKGRCETDSSTKSGYKENADGTVIFKSVDEDKNLITIAQFIEGNPKLISPLGGHQGWQGQMAAPGIQFDYAAGSFWDKLAEAYSGTHDTLNSVIWYDELGNGKKLDGTLLGQIGATTNMTNVIVATPFALSVLLPPEVWNAVFTIINSTK
jgi:filamentous hemagglutinin